MKFDQQLASGTSQGRKRRISELCLRLKLTGGKIFVGNNSGRNPALGIYGEELQFRTTDTDMDTSAPLYSGDYTLPWEPGADTAQEIQITQTQPLPIHVLGIFAKMEFFGE